MQVLVTGVAGFIGSNMAAKLLAAGHQVTGIDNFSPYYDVHIKHRNVERLKLAGLNFIEADLAETIVYNDFPKSFDYIIHFAAQPGISATVSFDAYYRNNIQATQLLIAYAETITALKLFINISTSSVYGLDATQDESRAPEPASMYGVTKLAAEQLVLSHVRQQKLNAISLRLYSVYGPGERPDKLYTKLITSLQDKTAFPLYDGSLQHKRSFTFVGDITEGIMQVFGKENILNGEIINLGSDVQYTTEEGIAAIETILKQKIEIHNLPARTGDQLSTKAIIEKAKSLIGYNPLTTLQEGLQQQVEWYNNRKMD